MRAGRLLRRLLATDGCALVLVCVAASAQRPPTETFTLDDGLLNATISDLAQDAAGRLLIRHQGGISVYDGQRITHFGPDDGLTPQELGALTVDADGRPWTTTLWSGPTVSYFDGGRWSALPEPRTPMPRSGDSHTRFVRLAVRRQGEEARSSVVVVAAHDAGLWLWDGDTWRHGVEGLPGQGFTALAVYERGMAVATLTGLCRLEDLRGDCRFQTFDPRLSEPILGLATTESAGGTRLWIVSHRWLGYLEGRRLHVLRELDEGILSLSRAKTPIAVDAAGGVYFGQQDFAYFLPPGGEVRRLDPRHGLVAVGATALLSDRDGNVWVGGQRGLTRLGSRRFLSYDRAHGLFADEVSAVLEARPGEMILGHEQGLSLLGDDGEPEIFVLGSPGDPRNSLRVLDAARGPDGTVYLAANDAGLLRLDGGRHFRPVRSDEPVTSVELAPDGRLFFSTPRKIYTFDGTTFSRLDHGQRFHYIRWLKAAPRQQLYAATMAGLFWLDDTGWHEAQSPSGSAGNVFTVFVDPNGKVWAGTQAGLYELHRGELVPAGEPALRQPVYFILTDSGGRYWFGTNDGVVRWDGSRMRRLSVEHGLVGRETNRGAGAVDHRGRVWIGTDRGVSMYQSEYDQAPRPPVVELLDVEVNGAVHPLADVLRLASWQNNLTFHYRAVSFADEGRLRVRYRLGGEEEVETALASTAGIRYTHLPPGRYRFRLAAGWPGGPWSDEVLSPPIVIVRPLWQKPWFYLLAGISVLGVVATGYGLRIRAFRRRTAQLETLNAKLSESMRQRDAAEAKLQLLIDDLRQKNDELQRFTYSVSHDLKSPLITIRGFLGFLKADTREGNLEKAAHDIELIEGAAEKMGRLLNDLLQLSRVGRVANVKETLSLAELAAEAVHLVAGEIAGRAVEVSIDPALPSVHGDRTRLVTVFQNLIDNAVKYMGDQPEPRVEIGVRPDGDGSPVVFVRDNGSGIEERYLDQVFGLFERLSHDTPGSGLGLALVKRIVEVHGGRIWAESRGVGQGACFCLTLGEESSPPEPSDDG